jgi:hypothetical protein
MTRPTPNPDAEPHAPLDGATWAAMTPQSIGPDRERILLLLRPEHPPGPGDHALAATPLGTVVMRIDPDAARAVRTAAHRTDVLAVLYLVRGAIRRVAALALYAGALLHGRADTADVPIMGAAPVGAALDTSHVPHLLTVRAPDDTLTDHVVWRTMTDVQRASEFGSAHSGPTTRHLADLTRTLPWARELARLERLERYSPQHAHQVYRHLAGLPLAIAHVLEFPELYTRLCLDLDRAAAPTSRPYDTGPEVSTR